MSLLSRLRRPSTAAGEAATPADLPAQSTGGTPTPTDDTAPTPERARWRTVAARVTTVLAALLVLAVLTAPDRLDLVTPVAFLRVPIEGLVVAALLLALPGRARRLVAVPVGAALGLVAISRCSTSACRPASPARSTWCSTGCCWTTARLRRRLGGHRRRGRRRRRAGRPGGRPAGAHHPVGAAADPGGGRAPPGRHPGGRRPHGPLGGRRDDSASPVADSGTRDPGRAARGQVGAGLRDREEFAAQVAQDAFRDTPGDQLLTALRGKDVVLAFVESYGRDAVEDPEFAAQVGAVLDGGTSGCAAAGFAARSGFLTSPTAGGGSWLAHATLLSGLWIDNQQRHDSLLASDRLTLNGAFRRAGWRTVGVMPAATSALAGGGVLRLRPVLRRAGPRLPGPAVQLRADARPVHPVQPSSGGSGPRPATPR